MAYPFDRDKDEAIHILLVAENPPFLHITTSLLNRYPDLVVVGTARGCQETLAQAKNLRPQVVLLDLDMSDRSGLKTIACLRAALPDVPVIALCLLAPATYRKVALAAGASELVHKLALNTDLLPAIRRALGKGA